MNITHRQLLLRAAGLIAVLVFFYVALRPLRYLFDSAGEWLAVHVGLWGVFGYTYLVDTLIVPATPDLLFPFVLKWPAGSLLLVMSLASVAGGVSGYYIGRALPRADWVRRALEPYRERGHDLVSKYGTWAVVLAALSPLPFSVVSWTAGTFGMPIRRYLPAAVLRAPRIVAAYYLVQAGVLVLGR